MEQNFGPDPEYKVVHIGLHDDIYFQMMNNVVMLEMNIVHLNNLDTSLYRAKDSSFSRLGKLLYTHLLLHIVFMYLARSKYFD